MLYELIALDREDIGARTTTRVRARLWPSVSDREIEYGVPLFLTQLSETLRLEATQDPFSSDAIGSSATRHGAELSAAGCSVAQVVHDYGDICQAITEIAVEQHAPITVEEFHTLNRCLDSAIAEAVTEQTRLTKTECVIVVPSMTKVAIGIGGSYGRGARWSVAPVQSLTRRGVPPRCMRSTPVASVCNWVHSLPILCSWS
jgi:hypothetical protein